MADPKASPFGVFQDWLDSFEAIANAASNKALENEQVARSVTQIATLSAYVNRASETLIERYLEKAQLPSRGQVEALHERLRSVEAKVDLLAAALTDRSNAALTPVRPPTRTRKPLKP